MTSKKLEAYWEIEVQVPTSDRKGDDVDWDLAEKFINEIGDCNDTETWYDHILAYGQGYFSTAKVAYQWKINLQAKLLKQFPVDQYKFQPLVFCGIRVNIDDDDRYLELVKDGDTHIFKSDYPEEGLVELTLDEVSIVGLYTSGA